MEEKKEKDFDQDFEDEELDLTKDAFFSDLMEMEEEIANEAYELVEHAMNLIESQYYDDSIEILRQAIGLYTQINREEEIKAINEKISEIYIFKETAFRETESELEVEESRKIEEPELIEEVEEREVAEPTGDMLKKTDQLIVEAHKLVNSNKFEEGLDKYDEAEKILELLGKVDEIERLYVLIEDCYNKKAEYLRGVKEEDIEHAIDLTTPLSEEQVKEKKLKQFIEAKKQEEEISSKTYEVLDKAVEMAKRHNYDQAIKLYEEGVKLFEQINWTYEAQRIRDTIEQLEREKKEYLKEIEREKVETGKKAEIKFYKEDLIQQQVKEISEHEREVQLERLRGIEFQKMEQDFFKAQIDNMATEAARMAREYELSIQKAIKEGRELEECKYPQVIEIYKKIKELLIDKGWISEAAIYDDTINVYIQKFEQDKKIRQIEIEKVKRKQETEKLLKLKEEDQEISLTKEQEKILEQQHLKAIEIQNIKSQIDEMTSRAERLAREYEVALRHGRFELKCPYPEIIDIYKKVRQIALERGWETDVTIFSSQIYNYKEKLRKDNRLREIEEEKAKKQEEIEQALKIEKQKPLIEPEVERLVKIEQQELIREEEEFDDIINVMINRAEKMAKEYESAMRKAIKKGKLAENPPFLKIIRIYERVKRMLLDKGREGESAIYNNQINYYSQKLDQDNKLREVEAKKAQREKDLEEMHKIGKDIGIDEEKLKSIEKRKEQEDFQKFISEKVNNAEKMVRDYEMAMRKAYRKGIIPKKTPYNEVIEIYKELREKVYARGWNDQADMYGNQIKIYQDKLEKHQNLLDLEAQKAQREKDIEELRKVERKVELDEEKLKIRDLQKEDEEFQENIIAMVNKAEKLERDFDSAMKKAIKKGEVVVETPYFEIIEIYSQIKDLLVEKGWIEQLQMYANQIKIYQEKLEKHQKLLEVEAQKAQREKDLEEMRKVERRVELDKGKLKVVELKKEEKEFEENIIAMVNKAEKLERDFDSAMKKAIKKGEIIVETPYLEIIEIYAQIKDLMVEKGWIDQSQMYANQVNIYNEKLEKHQKLLEVEAQKVQREKDLEELQKIGKKKFKPVKPEKIRELKEGDNEQDLLLSEAMSLIDKAEKTVKDYELNIRKDILVYESPYDKVISNYEEAREIFKKIGWNDEANRLVNTIKFYKDKKEKDDKLRVIEQKKLDEPKIELESIEIGPDKEFLERQKRLVEIQQKEKESDEITAKIFNMIQNAERMAQEYELKLKDGFFDFEAPYEKIIEIYNEARKNFEQVGWKEESNKLKNTIRFYKEKSANDKKIRALEAEKIRKREEELALQQRLLEEAREKQERLLKKRRKVLDLKRVHIAHFETQKDKAFRLMDQAKRELRDNNFDSAIEKYKESEEIFTEIEWQEGINMVRDSIAMIKNKKKVYELEKQAMEEKKIEALKIEEKLEQKLTQANILREQLQEEKRKELLKIQAEKEHEGIISDKAYSLLEEGTVFMNHGKFIDAYEKFINARELFQNISWHREVSRINNDLLFKLKREQKRAEILEEIKVKKIEEEKQIALLQEETKREKEEFERKQKEEKRELARKELDMKISVNLDKANELIGNFRYNEGVLILRKEIKRLTNLGKNDEIEDIKNQINELKSQLELPLIVLEVEEDYFEDLSFKSAYEAIDEAQVSIANDNLKKAISELNEAQYKLKELKFGKNSQNKIKNKISELKAKITKTPIEELEKKVVKDEEEVLRERITARREERRKKVLKLLRKDDE